MAFLWVKLHAQHRIAADDRRDLAAVVDMGQTFCGGGDGHVIAVHEIGVIAGLQPVEDRVVVVNHEVVPAHMGDFELRVFRGDLGHLAADPAQPGGILVFAAHAGHQLHADADAEEGAALFLDRLDHRVIEAASPFQGGHTGREGAIARQDQTVGAGHDLGIRGHRDLACVMLAGHTLEGFMRGVQVAGFVVDDCCQHWFTRHPWWREWRLLCGGRSRPLRGGRGRRI